jgi:hypothetical protein
LRGRIADVGLTLSDAELKRGIFPNNRRYNRYHASIKCATHRARGVFCPRTTKTIRRIPANQIADRGGGAQTQTKLYEIETKITAMNAPCARKPDKVIAAWPINLPEPIFAGSLAG